MSDDSSTVVEALRSALEARRYQDFVDHFAVDATYELPFALPGTPSLFTGIAEIRARFDAIAQSPLTKLLDVEKVSATLTKSTDPNVVTVELSTRARARTGGATFEIASSIAVIRFEHGQVKRYRDYPNTLGIAKAAGVLPQLVASLK